MPYLRVSLFYFCALYFILDSMLLVGYDPSNFIVLLYLVSDFDTVYFAR